MEITEQEYDKCFEGFRIQDAVVRSSKIFYFVLREDYTESDDWDEGDEPPREADLKMRVVVYAKELPPADRWSFSELTGFAFLFAGATTQPLAQFAGVDMGGNVYILGSGERAVEKTLEPWSTGGLRRGAIRKSRTIDGSLYVCGAARTVARRDGKNQWHSYTHSMPFKANDFSEGFRDIDGFDEKDIYCVGGSGDVWNFNGKEWLQIHFPSNIDLYTVCCAGDGFVYISGFGGTTFKGRGDKWQRLFEHNLTIPLRDMVWYEDKIWCTNEYGLWTIENGKLVDAEVDNSILISSGNLSVADGVMLLAGFEGIAYRENGAWHKIA